MKLNESLTKEILINLRRFGHKVMTAAESLFSSETKTELEKFKEIKGEYLKELEHFLGILIEDSSAVLRSVEVKKLSSREDYLRSITPSAFVEGNSKKTITSSRKKFTQKGNKDEYLTKHALECRVSTMRAYFDTSRINIKDAEDAIKLYIRDEASFLFKYEIGKRRKDTGYRKVYKLI